MTTTLRRLAALVCCILALAAVAGPAAGAERVQRFVVPTPPGASPDLMARILAEHMGATLATSFVVENKPGASGAIAVESVLAPSGAPALLLAGLDHLLCGPASLGRKPRDPLADVQLIGLVNLDRWVLVGHPATARDLALMRRTARDRPLRCANAGQGSTQHAVCAWVARRLGMAVEHIPYSQPYLPDLIGGRVDIAVAPVPGVAAALRTSRVAGVMLLARERLASLPAIPTSAELDAGALVFEAGLALYGSPGLSEAEVDRLHDALQRAQADEGVQKRFVELGVDPVHSTRGAAAQALRDRMQMVDKIRLEAFGRAR